MRWFVGITLLVSCGAAWAEDPPTASTGRLAAPLVDVEGTVAKVRAEPGLGMPSLEVEADGRTTRVLLGSMRYLVQNDFNPKAGEGVRVEGFQLEDAEVLAKSVTLKDQGKTLEFRDGDGRPLWSGGRHGRGRHRQGPPKAEVRP